MIIAYVTTSGEPVIRIALDPSADSYCNLITRVLSSQAGLLPADFNMVLAISPTCVW